jgi:hypothetical protein
MARSSSAMTTACASSPGELQPAAPPFPFVSLSTFLTKKARIIAPWPPSLIEWSTEALTGLRPPSHLLAAGRVGCRAACQIDIISCVDRAEGTT